jgi:rRNA maturation protein Nop10
MAEVRLGRQQAETGDVPPNCMRCGQQTEVWIPRQFSASNNLQSRRMLVLAPLCQRHRNHWRNRIRINLAILICLVLIAAALVFAPPDLQIPLWICLGVGVPLWLIFNIVYQQLLIRAAEITDHTITLKRISPTFIEAFEQKKAADRRRGPETGIPQKLRQIQGKLIDVRLGRREVEGGELPKVCMRCGAPAAVILPRKLSWHPEWIGLLMLFVFCFLPIALVGIILAFALTKRMKVPIPLCQAHRRHWVWKNVVGIVGLVLLLTVGGIGLIVLGQTNMPRDTADRLGGILCGGTFFGFFLWLIALIILEGRAIKAAEITDRGITLRGVSPVFLQALWEHRQVRKVEVVEEVEDELPPTPMPAQGEFFDPNAARRRRPSPEENDS